MLRLALLAALLNVASSTNAAGIAFLKSNKDQEGVVELPSGLQYKVLRKGTGDSHPTANSPCECHYEGRTATAYPSGATFDSSYARGTPTTFAPNQVIKGWTEAMQLMVEGDKWELYIPSDLAYGDRGRPPKIGGGDCLIFTIEILKIKGGKVAASKEEV
uniref:peptidylprolyl isomerase n=1 Tax=Haptolina brevifila TaxID=156173 RepID=A0A7S2I9I5_9EUKA|mmetsp:Transcript_62885/g.124212  ORF Transcript_62885/g.124212 Transcript_62885/m.124212 type:complete len:160 (+) Transcript_62885:36-515(+)